jgi:hypothetical protein
MGDPRSVNETKKEGGNMKRIGTASAAVGLVFLGVWLMLNHINGGIAEALFKWWPIIIIILGLEILLGDKKNTQSVKTGFNGLIIVVIMVFLVINATQSVCLKFDNMFKNGMSIFMGNFGENNCKSIRAAKTIEADNKEIVILANNGNLNVKKSQDNMVRIETEIEIDKASALTEWDINTLVTTKGVRIDFRDAIINCVSGDIYVPKGSNIRFEVDNINMAVPDTELGQLTVDSKNGDLNLGSDIKNIQAKMQNGKVNFAGNSESINLDIDNGEIDINGVVSSMELKLKSGTVDINNKNEKASKVEIKTGTIRYNTNNQDANVSLKVNSGLGLVNGRKIESGSSNDIFGTGANSINLKVVDGTIRFIN